MKTIIKILLVAVLASYCLAGSLEPTDSLGSTMKTLDEVEPRIPINQNTAPPSSSYKYVISTAGSYYLTENTTCSISGIRVDADDVKIDLCGYTLTGPNTTACYGIYTGKNNVQIRNGTIRDFNYGIGASGACDTIKVFNITAISNVTNGIYVPGRHNIVQNCIAAENGTGSAALVYGIHGGSDSKVEGNNVYGNGQEASGNVYGIYTGYSCVVRKNISYQNGVSATGSYVRGIIAASGCSVTKNVAHENGNAASAVVYGIMANSGSTVQGNVVYDNGELATGSSVVGLYVAPGCAVIGNAARDNGSSAFCGVNGIYVNSGCTVIENIAYNNGPSATGTVYGIKLSADCMVDRNAAYANNGTNMDLTISSCVYGLNCAP